MIMIFLIFLYAIPIFILFSVLRKLISVRRSQVKRVLSRKLNRSNDFHIFGFFHPYCNAGGGGERVLWLAINALQKKFGDRIVFVVYTGDTEVSAAGIRKKVRDTFDLEFSQPIEVVYLKSRFLVESRLYPHFTLIFQALGSIVLGLEALWRCVPDCYIDTMGYAFTYPVFSVLATCKVACYVHYPFISTDMLARVSQRSSAFNNASVIANSSILSSGKWLYYFFIAKCYGFFGRYSELVMVNSSWTRNHILNLWGAYDRTALLYPPCGSEKELRMLRKVGCKERRKLIVSIGQFRPEKNHILQLEAFSLFLRNSETAKDWKLVIVGGARNSEDEDRVACLRRRCRELKLGDSVELKVNAPYEEWMSLRKTATIGLHTMVDEHFGIGVVECMASGLVMLAHDSAGPQMDIVCDEFGFLATTAEEYADALDRIVEQSDEEREELVERAQDHVSQFSDEAFCQKFCGLMQPLIDELRL